MCTQDYWGKKATQTRGLSMAGGSWCRSQTNTDETCRDANRQGIMHANGAMRYAGGSAATLIKNRCRWPRVFAACWRVRVHVRA